ncbi:MAG: hypothetical protein ACREV6_04540 [Clostridium sp.]|uniref:hypothetical protein n=1 Tax=Clostridium sp. TaxID=1506 RepID=UPI003D6D13ED
MKRILKIIEAHWFLDPSGSNWLIPASIIITGLISITICTETTKTVHNYICSGTTIGFSAIVLKVLNLMILSCVSLFNAQRVSTRKGKVTVNMNDFLIQAPILKKDLFNAKFIIFQVVSIPLFIVVIYFIRLNVFISTSELISAYSGFLVLIYCIWTMTLSISIGFSSMSAKKYKVFRYLFPVLLLLSMVFAIYLSNIPYVQPGTLVSQQNMFSGLGPRFIPILKACSHIGGVSGLIVILISSIISYYLSCKLPLKISQEVGN